MTVASCPSCRESVTVPVDATPECIVRCPLCHEEFQLRDFLNQLPPALIVLDGGATSGDTADSDAVSDAVGVTTDDDIHQAGAATEEAEASSSNVLGAYIETGRSAPTDDSAPAFDFTPGSVEDDEPAADGTEKSRRRRGKNPVIEALKIIAGALLAVPAAQIILWMLPGDMKRDLLGIGPAVSRVVPWVVPQQFRANSPTEIDQGEASLQIRPRRPATGNARPRANSGSAQPSRPVTASDAVAKQPRSPATPDELEAGDMSSGGQSSAKSSGLDRAADKLATPPAQSADKKVSQELLVNGVRGVTPSDMEGLENALRRAVQANEAWDTKTEVDPDQRTLLGEELYTALAQLGEAVTFPPPNNPGIPQLIDSLNNLIGSFATEPEKLAMIGNRAAAWLDRTDRPNQGVLLFGTVKKITASLELYETQLELAAIKKRSVTVVSRVDPRGTFGVGDRILMLGAVVEQPDRNLLGYEGSEPMIVMGGFPVRLR